MSKPILIVFLLIQYKMWWVYHLLAKQLKWFVKIKHLILIFFQNKTKKYFVLGQRKTRQRNSVQNTSTVINPTMDVNCILLPFTLPCSTTWQISNSLLSKQPHITLNVLYFVKRIFQKWTKVIWTKTCELRSVYNNANIDLTCHTYVAAVTYVMLLIYKAKQIVGTA